MRVTGLVRIVVDEQGTTKREARRMAETYPERHKCLFVENLEFEDWDEELVMTEADQTNEEE